MAVGAVEFELESVELAAVDELEADDEVSHIGRMTPETGLYAKACDF